MAAAGGLMALEGLEGLEAAEAGPALGAAGEGGELWLVQLPAGVDAGALAGGRVEAPPGGGGGAAGGAGSPFLGTLAGPGGGGAAGALRLVEKPASFLEGVGLVAPVEPAGGGPSRYAPLAFDRFVTAVQRPLEELEMNPGAARDITIVNPAVQALEDELKAKKQARGPAGRGSAPSGAPPRVGGRDPGNPDRGGGGDDGKAAKKAKKDKKREREGGEKPKKAKKAKEKKAKKDKKEKKIKKEKKA